jgi:trimethylamine---corrinoid protein Co-methyltransferase
MQNISQAAPQYRILNEEQIQQIHRASLEILETVGMRVHHEDAIQILRASGCVVRDDDQVYFPPRLVEACLKSVPSSVTIYNRKGEEAMRLEGRNVYYGLGTDLVKTWDLETNQLRPSKLQDVANAARVADACKEINFVASFALPSDTPVNAIYLMSFKTMLENTVKPLFFTSAGAEDLTAILEVAETAAGGRQALRDRPFLIQYSEPTSPLMQSYGAVSKLLLCAERGIPICYTPGALLGASAPVTLAGALAQTNAEALGSITLHQLKSRSAPMISGLTMETLDMRTTHISYGSPENRLTNSAFADLYHFYHIPMWSEVGSDAISLDEQAGWELAVGILMAGLDGANLIHDVGYLGQGLVGNPISIVMCDEIISYVRHILRGFGISNKTLAVDLIRKVGSGGNFLQEDHTLEHFRQELWRPSLANRDNPDVWEEKGGLQYVEKVKQKTLDILARHQPEKLDTTTQGKIETITLKALKTLENIEFRA